MDYILLWKSLFLLLMIVTTTRGQFCPTANKRIYTFAFSNDGFPANFLTEDGELIGHAVDLTKEICRFGGQKCRVSVVPRRYCWDNTDIPPFSLALNQHWYGACANLPPSVERQLNYDFMTENYFRTLAPSLIVAENSTYTLEDFKKCNDFTLAYPADTALEPDCLLDLSYFVKAENYVPIKSEGVFDLISITNQIEALVRKGEVDAALVVTIFASFDGVKALTDLQCSAQVPLGLNHMVRQDDEDFRDWFSFSLHEYMCSPEYPVFCNKLLEKYGSDPLCRVPGDDLDCTKFGGPSAKNKDKKPQRIFPCENQCVLLEHEQEWYVFKDQDDNDEKAEKALRGSGKTYSGEDNVGVDFNVNTLNGQRFVVQNLCLTTKRARSITVVFRKGIDNREVFEEPLTIADVENFTTTCVSNPDIWNMLLIKIDIRKVNSDKKNIMKIKNVYMDGCMVGSPGEVTAT